MISAENPVRVHHLKAFAKAPALARYALQNPSFDPSASMERGTAAHALLLGGRKVIGYEEGKQRKGKAFDEFRALNPNTEILTASDFDLAMGIAESVRSHERAMKLMRGDGIVNEGTLLFTLAGLPCRATPDAWGTDLVELKTCADSSPEKFYWQVKRMGYHVQLGWYEIAIETIGYPTPNRWYIVAVEQRPPHIPTVFSIGAKLREEGKNTARLWFEGLLNCYRTDTWPGYCQTDHELEISDTDDELMFADDEDEAA